MNGDARSLPRRARTVTRVLCALALASAAWGGTDARAQAPAAELPRVFFTPAERAAIRAARISGRPAVRAGDAEPAAVAQPATGSTNADAVRPLRVDGITLGRGTARAVWIGGERIADGARWRGYRVQVVDDGARLVAADGSVRLVRVGVEIPR